MIRQIKKEWNELRNQKEHMEYVPLHPLTSTKCFEELIKLTNRTNARFKVEGDSKSFVIRANSDNVILGFSLILLLFFPTVLLYQNYKDPVYWFAELGIIALILIYIRYSTTTNNIEVNTYDKTIKIQSNNFIGKHIIPSVSILFDDFTNFTVKAKSTKGKGLTNHFNRVYINYNNLTRPLIDLPNGPFYFVNHKVFMSSLTLIIKGTESTSPQRPSLLPA